MWIAEFKDNTIINQFDNGKENTFQKVLDRLEDLNTLSVIVNDTKYTVNLIDTKFTTDKMSFYSTSIPIEELENIRPIYFVRESVTLNFDNNKATTPTTMFVALGFQASYKDKNIKRYLAIYPNGNFVVKGD